MTSATLSTTHVIPDPINSKLLRSGWIAFDESKSKYSWTPRSLGELSKIELEVSSIWGEGKHSLSKVQINDITYLLFKKKNPCVIGKGGYKKILEVQLFILNEEGYRAIDLVLVKPISELVLSFDYSKKPFLGPPSDLLEQLPKDSPYINFPQKILTRKSGYRAVASKGENSLTKFIETSPPIPFSQYIKIAFSILEGYKILHEKGICHGDVSPGNILMRPDKWAAIIDFDTMFQEGRRERGPNLQTYNMLPPQNIKIATDWFVMTFHLNPRKFLYTRSRELFSAYQQGQINAPFQYTVVNEIASVGLLLFYVYSKMKFTDLDAGKDELICSIIELLIGGYFVERSLLRTKTAHSSLIQSISDRNNREVLLPSPGAIERGIELLTPFRPEDLFIDPKESAFIFGSDPPSSELAVLVPEPPALPPEPVPLLREPAKDVVAVKNSAPEVDPPKEDLPKEVARPKEELPKKDPAPTVPFHSSAYTFESLENLEEYEEVEFDGV